MGQLCHLQWETKTTIHRRAIYWTPVQTNPIMPWYDDTMYAGFWDDRINCYVAYLRDDDWSSSSHTRFRRIARAESEDFKHWPTPELILACDDGDSSDTDIYNSAAIKYAYWGLTRSAPRPPSTDLGGVISPRLCARRHCLPRLWRAAAPDRRADRPRLSSRYLQGVGLPTEPLLIPSRAPPQPAWDFAA